MLVVGVPLKRGMGGGQGSLAGSLIEDAACDECVCVCVIRTTALLSIFRTIPHLIVSNNPLNTAKESSTLIP
jgi:hypothetical protein